MKNLFFSFAVIMAVLFTGCSNELDGDGPASVTTKSVEIIAGNTIISSNTTWSSSNEYQLAGKVYVVSPATLTIEAGTVIKGLSSVTTVDASALIITRGAKINAIGRADSPIIMTAENGQEGGWGGLVLLGNAKINQTNPVSIEGINGSVVPVGVDINYGGNNDGDSSGQLSYVRIEYAGASIAEANELNAFTFGGVGRGTKLDHLQAYRGADDAFEFFGGCVDAKYLVSTATDDDAFDFDFGYTGRIQYAVATIDGSLTYSSDPNGIECDNDGSGSGLTPFTHPVLSNLTIVGTSSGSAATSLRSATHFRRNAQFTLVNSVLYGFPNGVIRETNNPGYTFENNVVASANAGKEFVTNTAGTSFFTPNTTNVATGVTALRLYNPWGGYKDPDALVPSSNPALSGATPVSGMESVSYKGAFDPAASAWTSDSWVK